MTLVQSAESTYAQKKGNSVSSCRAFLFIRHTSTLNREALEKGEGWGEINGLREREGGGEGRVAHDTPSTEAAEDDTGNESRGRVNIHSRSLAYMQAGLSGKAEAACGTTRAV